jgi:hypothetical protein
MVRTLRKCGLLAAIMALAACACGHYDKDGHYVTSNTDGVKDYGAPPAAIVNAPVPEPQTEVQETVTRSYAPATDTDTTTTRTTTITTYGYERAGLYDARGIYVAPGSGPAVPASMMPPEGLCRIWFANRPLQNQPGIESCQDIRTRVPLGSYVIYGG